VCTSYDSIVAVSPESGDGLVQLVLESDATRLDPCTQKACLGSCSLNSCVISEGDAFPIGSRKSFHSDVDAYKELLIATWIVCRSALWFCLATWALTSSCPNFLSSSSRFS
ncbi:UNVERIFIED_CONTAM: hypothetical protein Sindi_0962200, partial [Sesamum indicum]